MPSTPRPTGNNNPIKLRQRSVAECAAELGATHTRGEVMASNKKRALAVVAAASMAVSLAACGGGSSSDNKASAGGTLYYYAFKPYEHYDPQRSYLGLQMSNMTRLNQ